MDRWRGKIAVVTGASSGIGLAIAKALLRQGLIVVGLARRKDKMLDDIRDVENSKNFYANECDVSNSESVEQTFQYIKNTFKHIHVLVNNAGLIKMKSIEQCSVEDLQQVIDVNVMGVLYCTKEAIKIIKENGNEAHVINVSSVAGLKVANHNWFGGNDNHCNVYSPSKFAVTALSETLVNELMGHKIRVTNLSPGYVLTEIFDAKTNEQEFVDMAYLTADDVADSVLYVLQTPPHVQITQLTIKPLGEKF